MSDMRRKLRTEITIETHEVSIIRRRERMVRTRCASCGKQVNAITLNEATALTGVDSQTMRDWLKTGKVHFTERAGLFGLICFNSVSDF